MKLAIIADIHGDFKSLDRVVDALKGKDFDVVISPGDFTDMFKPVSEFSQLDIADMIIQKILSIGKPVLCTPGNHDPIEIIDIFKEYRINLHNKSRKIKDISFIGFGGAKTPFNTLFEPDDDEIMEEMEKLVKTPGKKIFVTHNPPKNTKLDVVEKQHVGSSALRKLIEKTQPILSISAHIHEHKGTDMIGKTTVFYPGPVFEGYYGLVEITGDKPICKTLKA